MSDSEKSQYEQMIEALEAAYEVLEDRVARLKMARAGIAKVDASSPSETGTVLTVSCDSLEWANKEKTALKTVSTSETVPNGETLGSCGGVTGIDKREDKKTGNNIYTINFTDRQKTNRKSDDITAPKGEPGKLNDYWSLDGGRYKASVTLASVSATGLKGSVTGVSIGATGLSCSISLVKLGACLSYTSLAFVDSSLTACNLTDKIAGNKLT